MKGLFTAAALLFFFSACKESGVQLSKPSTFVKYYSDGNQNDAIDILETSDKGYLIMAHADSSKGGGINLTKTDFSGNIIWEKYIRKTGSDLRPSNFVAMKDPVSGSDQWYVIVGTLVDPTTLTTQLFVWRVMSDGTSKDSRYYARDSTSYGGYIIGKGVAQSSNISNDVFVVGQILKKGLVTPPVDQNGNFIDMFFAQLSGSKLDTVFTRKYGGGTTNLANRLYLDYAQTSAYWGGTRTDDQGLHMRYVKSGFNSQNTVFDLTYPIGDSGYTGNDFCANGYGFAFIGNHTLQEVVVAKVGSDGTPIDTLRCPSAAVSFTGNSICTTLDGGLLILGSIAADNQGINTDYYLIKVDAFGKKQWEVAHGGKYPDAGVRVLQSSDGGYIVLGTTTLANVKTVFLMKTDSRGNIE